MNKKDPLRDRRIFFCEGLMVTFSLPQNAQTGTEKICVNLCILWQWLLLINEPDVEVSDTTMPGYLMKLVNN